MSTSNCRTCSNCGESKAVDEFYPRQGRCKTCILASQKKFMERNADAIRKQRAANWQKKKERVAETWPVRAKTCKQCDQVFEYKERSGARAPVFCSHRCASDAMRTGSEKLCESCGKSYYPWSSDLESSRFCSNECRHSKLVGVAHPNWKGGSIEKKTGDHVLTVGHREGYVTRQARAHRLLIKMEIGRPLARTEKVLHINHINSDNRIENLFVCESLSEVRMRYMGSMPWPSVSNVGAYRAEALAERQRQAKPLVTGGMPNAGGVSEGEKSSRVETHPASPSAPNEGRI